MSKITDAFKNKKAFIPFITCGDPDLNCTARLIKAMEQSGADIIELGIPFSDPTAEGPVIQDANLRALSGGVTVDKIFSMLAELKEEGNVHVPLIFMTYANVVFSYGIERFLKRASETGIAGLILPDVPYEEREEFKPACRKYDIDFISLIAPTSHERIKMIAAQADGFVYCVSSLGVTGVRDSITADVGTMVSLVHQAAPDIPCAIGFGISTPAQAADMAKYADGVIVGSAIVKQIGKYKKDCIPYIEKYVSEMKASLYQP